MEVKEIINELLDIVNNQPVNLEEDFIIFTYVGDEVPEEYRNFYKIVSGSNNVKKYNEKINQLYEDLVNGSFKEKLSKDSFKTICQNLIIEEKLSKEDILNSIKALKEVECFEIRTIYGATMKSNVLDFNKYVFVNKNYIKKYLKKAYKSFDHFEENNQNLFKYIDDQLNENAHFVYLILKYKTIDEKNCTKINDKTINEIFNLFRFLYSNELTHIYLSEKAEHSYSIYNYLISDTNIRGKRITFPITYPILLNNLNKNHYYKKIWNLFLKNNKSGFEKRILKAIDWVGVYYSETNDELKISEIAFAFETLFNNSDEFISKSVTANLSECYAFVNGKNQQERIQLEKDFKNFYRIRSSIVHGNDKFNQFYPDLYKEMVVSTINNLLFKSSFKNCHKVEDFNQKIKKMRYR